MRKLELFNKYCVTHKKKPQLSDDQIKQVMNVVVNDEEITNYSDDEVLTLLEQHFKKYRFPYNERTFKRYMNDSRWANLEISDEQFQYEREILLEEEPEFAKLSEEEQRKYVKDMTEDMYRQFGNTFDVDSGTEIFGEDCEIPEGEIDEDEYAHVTPEEFHKMLKKFR